MKIVHELRERREFEPPKSSSPLAILLGAVIAFGIGLLGVSGVIKMEVFKPAPKTFAVAVPGAGEGAQPQAVEPSAARLGRAENAALVKACVPLDRLGIPREKNIESGDLYRLLWAASSMSRVAAVTGIKQKAIDDVEFTAIWADLTDCVYRQNGWTLCNPDNRALAVEAANTFVRQLATATIAEKSEAREARNAARSRNNRDYILQSAQSVKERVFDGLRQQVSDGRLIAADFGMFAPAEVVQLVRGTKLIRNGCPSQS